MNASRNLLLTILGGIAMVYMTAVAIGSGKPELATTVDVGLGSAAVACIGRFSGANTAPSTPATRAPVEVSDDIWTDTEPA